MNVQLKELFDIIGERKTIDYSITADKLSEYGGYSFASPVAVTGEIENRAGGNAQVQDCFYYGSHL